MTTYVYNEHDENQVLTMRNKLKKKKRKRRINFVLIVLLLIFLVIFFFGDMSKVKKITVSGCHLTSADDRSGRHRRRPSAGRRAGTGCLRCAGGHLPARERGVPHPRKLQGGPAQGQGQRYHRDGPHRRLAGACAEKPDEPGICPAGKGRSRQDGAGKVHAGQPAPRRL